MHRRPAGNSNEPPLLCQLRRIIVDRFGKSLRH
jgi:hypothetical protein